MTDSSNSACAPGAPKHHLGAAVLALAWVIYLGLVGPWLISEPSTVALLLGVLAALVLAAVTYYRLMRPVPTKEDTR